MHVLTNRFKEMWAITIHEWACCHSSLSLFIWELRMSNNAQLMSTAPSFFVWQKFGTKAENHILRQPLFAIKPVLPAPCGAVRRDTKHPCDACVNQSF